MERTTHTSSPETTRQGPEFSVIITCYYEEKSIDEFHGRLTKVMQSLGRSFEIIIVNDGSTDGTFAKLKEIFARDPYVSTIIDLFRNYGQVAAITAGICKAKGENYIFMDSDLQLDPEDLPGLIVKFDEGYDYVTGFRESRQDSFFRILPSAIANIIMRKVSKSTIQDFGCNAKIFRGSLFRAYELGPFKVWHSAPMIAHTQRIAQLPITHHPRKYGQSGWTFKKLWQYNMENILRLSDKPFQFMFVVCLFFSFFFFIRIVLAWFSPFHLISTVTPGLILNVLTMMALVIVALLCIIGEFVIRIFIKLQKDPCFIVREMLQKEVMHG